MSLPGDPFRGLGSGTNQKKLRFWKTAGAVRRCGEARRPLRYACCTWPSCASPRAVVNRAAYAHLACPGTPGAVVHSPPPSTAPRLPRKRAATWITPRLRGGLRDLDLRPQRARVRLPDAFSNFRSAIQYPYQNQTFLLTSPTSTRSPCRQPAAFSSPAAPTRAMNLIHRRTPRKIAPPALPRHLEHARRQVRRRKPPCYKAS